MTHWDLLREIGNKVDDAIERESWEEARLGLRELARFLVDATIAGDGELIARVDEMLSQVFTDLSLSDSFVPELTVTALGWSADGLRDIAQFARRRRPPMTAEQRAATLRDAEARMLALLDEGNRAPRSNREIADRLELNVATVARTLAKLRAAKKVKSWPEGRFVMNQIVANSSLADAPQVENARVIEASREAADVVVIERKNSPDRKSPMFLDVTDKMPKLPAMMMDGAVTARSPPISQDNIVVYTVLQKMSSLEFMESMAMIPSVEQSIEMNHNVNDLKLQSVMNSFFAVG